jgi:hypothetical protein
LHSRRLLQSRGQADAAGGQHHCDVAAADPDIFDSEPSAFFVELMVKAPCDFARFKHLLLIPDFNDTVKREGLLTAGPSGITISANAPEPSGRIHQQGGVSWTKEMHSE